DRAGWLAGPRCSSAALRPGRAIPRHRDQHDRVPAVWHDLWIRCSGRRAGPPDQAGAGSGCNGDRDRGPGRLDLTPYGCAGNCRPRSDPPGAPPDRGIESTGRCAMSESYTNGPPGNDASRDPLEGRRVALGVTGSIAAFKAVALASALTQRG